MSQFPQAEAAIDPHKRPIAITIICVIFFIGAIATSAMFFMDVMRSLPPWYPYLLGVSAVRERSRDRTSRSPSRRGRSTLFLM